MRGEAISCLGIRAAVMAISEDKDRLLLALGKDKAGVPNRRPSAVQAQMNWLPEWSRDRLFDALEALQQDGMIMSPSHGMVNVDLTSTALDRIAALTAAPTPQTVHIGTNINSPIQQVGAHGRATQTISYQTSRDDLERFIAHFRTHGDELGLHDRARKQAEAQVATIEAQLTQDEPNPIIVREAGKSLRTIVEGAVGGAVGTALSNPGLWLQLASMLGVG